jgi:hypothetical protein
MENAPSTKTVATLLALVVLVGLGLAWALAQVREPPPKDPAPFGLLYPTSRSWPVSTS